MRKLNLKIVGYVDEVLVEPSYLQGNLAPDREITAHKAVDPLGLGGCKMEMLFLRKIYALLPRLDYPACDNGCAGVFVCSLVSSNEVILRQDIVVNK